MKDASSESKSGKCPRLHPRLRLVANRTDEINATGAMISSRVASTQRLDAGTLGAEAVRTLAACESFANGSRPGSAVPVSRQRAPRAKMQDAGLAKQAYVNVFVEARHADPDSPNPVVRIAREIETLVKRAKLPDAVARRVQPRRNFVSATVPVETLPQIAAIEGVAFVHPADSIQFSPPPVVASNNVLQPSNRSVKVDGMQHAGENVLIGIVDVGGFDFAHEDFLDAEGNTRFVAIWDQGGNFRAPPSRFEYGAEFTAERLRRAVAAARGGGLPAVDIERQSQRSPNSHATHVASIAAGNHGVCPRAKIAGVLVSIDLPDAERDQRRWTFSDSSRIVDAIEYLYALGKAMDLPVSINISLGTNGGGRDGSNGVCRWIDSSLSTPGRSISVAAGNAGQEIATGPDDLGWVMGRIHTMGEIPSAGLAVDLDWVVVGDGIADVSENELEIWYEAQDRISVALQPPGSTEWFSVEPKQFIENRRLDNGTVISLYSELYHPTNGDNYVAIYLSPNLGTTTFAPVAPGVWKVRLTGTQIRSGRFHAWIERDDPMEIDRIRNLRAFRFPSFFSARSNVDSHSISSLACAHRVVGVANVDSEAARVNISSSQGPTRDGRSKPDIAAAGTDIVAANGFGDTPWVQMTGTSMASPYVCGVMGLMLAAKPSLNAAQCQGILKRTARPLPSHGYSWRNDAGFGEIDAAAAIAEAIAFDERDER